MPSATTTWRTCSAASTTTAPASSWWTHLQHRRQRVSAGRALHACAGHRLRQSGRRVTRTGYPRGVWEGLIAALGLAHTDLFRTASLSKAFVGRAGFIACRDADIPDYFTISARPAALRPILQTLPAGRGVRLRTRRTDRRRHRREPRMQPDHLPCGWHRTTHHGIARPAGATGHLRRPVLPTRHLPQPLLNTSLPARGPGTQTEPLVTACREVRSLPRGHGKAAPSRHCWRAPGSHRASRKKAARPEVLPRRA